MPTRRRRLLAALPRRGLAPQPPQGSVAAVRHLAHDARRPPDQRRAEELRPSCRDWRPATTGAARTFRLHPAGSRVCDARPLPRPWPGFARGRPRHPPQLPVVLRPQDVRDLLAWVKTPPAPMGRRRSAAGGRRRTAGPPRQGSDRAAHRRLGQGRCGQGGQARGGPLAPRGRTLVRADWQRPRPRPGLFPARPRAAPVAPTARHKPCNAGVRQSGLPQEASLQTRRPAAATQRRARGVSLRGIQDCRGPHRPRPPARSTPLTPPLREGGPAPLATRMADR
jgi:hypothetical protein